MFGDLLSRTPGAHVRSVGAKAKYLLFATCAFAVWQKQKFYRANLADEDNRTHDRIARSAHVVLPDGRMAQVYPVVHTDTSLCGIVRAVTSSLNPLP